MALLTSNACYGLYLIVLKLALLAKIPLPVFLSRVFLVGLIGLLVMFVVLDVLSLTTGIQLLHRPGGESTLFATLIHAPWVVWVIATWGGLIVSPVPYALNGFAIRHVSPIVVAIFSDIENPLCSLLAILFLGEAISTWQIIGSAVVSIGVIVAASDNSGMVTNLPQWLERRVTGTAPAEVELKDTNQKDGEVAAVHLTEVSNGDAS
jgi:drug/metabolite transporter (DMT)-like permease